MCKIKIVGSQVCELLNDITKTQYEAQRVKQ
jgi:hypothetical protein